MARTKAVWGIDIGRCALKAVKIRILNDVPEVIAFDIVEHEQILSQPDTQPDQRAELIQKSMDTFLGRNQTQGDGLCISVPGQQTFSRFTKLPPVEEKKIPDIVNFEAGQQIPFDIEEVVWDYQVFREEDSPDVEVGIFAMKKELVRHHMNSFTSVQLEPTVVQAVPLALYNFLRFDQPIGDKATILIDIGTENTDLVVAYGQSVWTRSIPLGGNNFTDALVKAFKLSFNKAENLKRTAATSKYARQIFQAMRPVFADLVAEVQRSIGFYTSTHREVEMGKVLGVGNAFRLPGLQKYLQQNLQLEVERLSEYKRLNVAPTLKAPQFAEHVLSFAVSYGLALQGAELSAISSNLLPTEIARSVIWRKKRPFFAAAAACVLLAAGAMWARYSMDSSALAGNIGSATGVSVPSIPLQQAYDAMANPQSIPAENLAPREFTTRWLAVAEAMKKEFDSRRGKGNTEQKKIEQITGLMSGRELVPKIIAWLGESLPVPRPPFDQATDAADLIRRIEQAKQAQQYLMRPERRQVFIENCQIDYVENLGTAVINQGPVRGAGRAPRQRAKNNPGFVVTLDGSTTQSPPAKAAVLISQEFIPRLRELSNQPGRGFHVSDSEEPDMSVRPKGAAPGGQTPSYVSRPPGPGYVPDTSQTTARAAGTVDPVTGESTADDTEFTLTIALELGDAPQQPDKPK